MLLTIKTKMEARRTMRSAILCFFAFVGFTVWYQLRCSPVSMPDLPTLQTLNSRVAVLTCCTFGVAYPSDFSVNVCLGGKWRGFTWKLKQFLHYVDQLEKEDTIVVLLDGMDVFVNRYALAHDFNKKWKDLDADVVVSSEEACSAADDCYEDMISYLYPNLSQGKSPFVNSGSIAGYKTPLAHVLRAMIRYGGGRDNADDQLAATQIVNGNIALPAGIRVVHDTHQDLFGSFVHLAKYDKNGPFIHGTKGHPGNMWFKSLELRTCTDGKGKAHVLDCIVVGIKVENNNYIAMKDGVEYHVNENCDVERVDPLLGNKPVFWHGNGPGGYLYEKMQEKRVRCLADKN